MIMSDFPKIHCPFIRQQFGVNVGQWKEHGRALQLRTPSAYLVVDVVNPGYEWVFDDKDTIAVEKLDGSNVKVRIEGGCIVALQNRKNVIDPLELLKGKTFIQEGIFVSADKGLLNSDGEHAGELIGPKVQGNPYKLPVHEFYPFTAAVKRLKYRSFHEHDRTFDNWSMWFKEWLVSRYYTKRASKLGIDDSVLAEGVVFYNLRRRADGLPWMAKLRRDMFEWYYSDRVEIYDYDKTGGSNNLQNQSEGL